MKYPNVKYKKQLAVAVGTNNIELDVSIFSTGYYLLEVETETDLYRVQRKLVKGL